MRLEGELDVRYEAEVIKFRLKTEAKMSLKDVAKTLGCDPSTVSMVVSGRRSSSSITSELLKLLKEDDPAALWPSKFASRKNQGGDA